MGEACILYPVVMHIHLSSRLDAGIVFYFGLLNSAWSNV